MTTQIRQVISFIKIYKSWFKKSNMVKSTGGSVCSHLPALVLCSWIFLPWRWRRYVPSKHRITQDLHSATSQKMTFFIVTVVKASNLTRVQKFWLTCILQRCTIMASTSLNAPPGNKNPSKFKNLKEFHLHCCITCSDFCQLIIIRTKVQQWLIFIKNKFVKKLIQDATWFICATALALHKIHRPAYTKINHQSWQGTMEKKQAFDSPSYTVLWCTNYHNIIHVIIKSYIVNTHM
jgi:hypothetical protein